jgi:excinuclease ABC subunit A
MVRRRPSIRRSDIRIVGARTHNLHNVTVRVPQGALTVITGLSGSGKSSLAFDTLYAEGQRRYAESMSTYARQFLERLDRPDVDSIEPVPPAIALEQKNGVRNARSTVGTQTEIADALRLLFAHGGTTFCPDCGVAAAAGGVDAAAENLASLAPGTRVTLVAPVAMRREETGRKRRASRQRDDGERLRLEELRRAGFFRAVSPQGETVEIPEEAAPLLDQAGRLAVVVGRFVAGSGAAAEIESAVASAFALAGCAVARLPEGERTFRRGLSCPRCGRDFRERTPALFASNSPLGACPACQGFGRVVGIDLDKVVPNRTLTLEERPVAPWNTPAYESAYDDLFEACRKYGVRTDVPVAMLKGYEREVLEKGRGDFYGIEGFFNWLESKRYKVHVRVLLARYRAYTVCSSCHGARLTPEALFVRFRGKTAADIAAMPIGDLRSWLDGLELTDSENERLSSVLGEIRSRVHYLVDVGLEYLTLSRAARTLSGGEAQRIALASALGATLTGTLYVLDEPTIGLHPRDTRRLLRILRRLADRGNTVVVVEHDPEVIAAADHVIDLGPGAGSEGGRVVFEGTPAGLARARGSKTGEMLRRGRRRRPPESDRQRADAAVAGQEFPRRQADVGAPRRRNSQTAPGASGIGRVVPFRREDRVVTVVGAREHNLKDITVAFPLGRLVAVTGVSGSGKSSLVEDVLCHAYQRSVKGIASVDVGAHARIDGLEHVADLMLIDQSPLGRSARSNPVTYTKAYDEIRTLFARTGRARVSGVSPRDFSFNSPGGRCEACRGTGVVTIDMQFLADVVVTCEVCDGRRFGNRVLSVTYRGATIDDVLRMTVSEAMTFFADAPRITRRLQPLIDVGLEYVRLGQPTATLSGGEAQRLKLASFLEAGTSGRKGTLFLFDEPTTGLHVADVERLLGTFRRLIARGHSIIAIEHHLGFIAASDWVVDLGPGGGENGGGVVAEGPPEAIARVEESETGRYLAEWIGLSGPPPHEEGSRLEDQNR